MSKKQAAKPRQFKFVSKLLSAILSVAGVFAVFSGTGLSSAPAQADTVSVTSTQPLVVSDPSSSGWDQPRVWPIGGRHSIVTWHGRWFYDQVFARYLLRTHAAQSGDPTTTTVYQRQPTDQDVLLLGVDVDVNGHVTIYVSGDCVSQFYANVSLLCVSPVHTEY